MAKSYCEDVISSNACIERVSEVEMLRSLLSAKLQRLCKMAPLLYVLLTDLLHVSDIP